MYFLCLFTIPGTRIKHAPMMVFFVSILIGIISVFTPYFYAMVPITISHPVLRNKTRKEGINNSIWLSIYLVLIFIDLGIVVSVVDQTTGLRRLSSHWIFHLFFCRLFLGLGLSLLGAFEIKFPKRIIVATNKIAQNNDLHSLFFVALTLPVITFSSIGPMIVLVLMMAGKEGHLLGPIIGMFGFSVGLCVPFVYPRFINLLPTPVLNRINVLMGFLSVLISLKFFLLADKAGDWGLMGRDLFIGICILIFVAQGCYFMGWLKLSNDYPVARNIYGLQHVSLSALFIAIVSFTFALYMLPGLWGAPLKMISMFLPH